MGFWVYFLYHEELLDKPFKSVSSVTAQSPTLLGCTCAGTSPSLKLRDCIWRKSSLCTAWSSVLQGTFDLPLEMNCSGRDSAAALRPSSMLRVGWQARHEPLFRMIYKPKACASLVGSCENGECLHQVEVMPGHGAGPEVFSSPSLQN
jgi:hypothetical protein